MKIFDFITRLFVQSMIMVMWFQYLIDNIGNNNIESAVLYVIGYACSGYFFLYKSKNSKQEK